MSIEVALVGRLVADPELKQSAAGKDWCRVLLSVGYGDGSQRISVGMFGETARHVCDTFRKGDALYVDGGGLRIDEWTDRASGEKRFGLSMVAAHAEAPPIGKHKPKRTRQQAPADNDAAAPPPSSLSA